MTECQNDRRSRNPSTVGQDDALMHAVRRFANVYRLTDDSLQLNATSTKRLRFHEHGFQILSIRAARDEGARPDILIHSLTVLDEVSRIIFEGAHVARRDIEPVLRVSRSVCHTSSEFRRWV